MKSRNSDARHNPPAAGKGGTMIQFPVDAYWPGLPEAGP